MTEESLSYLQTNYTSMAHDVTIAVTMSVEMVSSLVTNLFILIFTICHPSILKNPSIIYLTNFILMNLILTIVYMPTVIGSAIRRQWVFGQESYRACQIMGYIQVSCFLTIGFTITVISVDRFLVIVKPFFHKRYVNAKVAGVTVAVIWLLSCLIATPPLFGYAVYGYTVYGSLCTVIWTENGIFFLTAFIIPSFVCLVIIVTTTVLTLCTTMRFISKIKALRDNQIRSRSRSTTDDVSSSDVYNRKVCRVFGMFGMFLFSIFLCYTPFFIYGLTAVIIGIEKVLLSVAIPLITAFTLLILTLNPLIQVYFRKELNEFLVAQKNKLVACFRRLKAANKP